jgi:hypothetical protein
MMPRKTLAALQTQQEALHAVLAKKKHDLAIVHAQLHEAERKALNRRRFQVGKMVLDTALAELTLEQLQEAFTALANCLHDDARWQAFLSDNREPSTSTLIESAVPGISSRFRENGTPTPKRIPHEPRALCHQTS